MNIVKCHPHHPHHWPYSCHRRSVSPFSPKLPRLFLVPHVFYSPDEPVRINKKKVHSISFWFSGLHHHVTKTGIKDLKTTLFYHCSVYTLIMKSNFSHLLLSTIPCSSNGFPHPLPQILNGKFFSCLPLKIMHGLRNAFFSSSKV